ncbi:MAG: hypothetical protein IPL59_18125 [Candidatus Competibacteraceae bacterium]|nr:hypothetical protein [Candidatus Competibacteraceae bacterium]
MVSSLDTESIDESWRPLQREGVSAARCTVERLMRQRACKGRPWQDAPNDVQ